ncbi:tRNA pseudouridine(38-40) synthase TruA [Psychromicrobium xiongbiense]|uniref:tRNA pseudouridine(38-40) synthase TruA n=1 Tax=Psychromicrobium xiongbiense TaxID=3051184 RepID=UPI00255267A3|nr:tRNA pseudouridine(38-40) synthase TruA [Psychromicrobium sp. YIM S02556]
MQFQKPAVTREGDGGFLRLRLDLAYDGAPFSGWAVQPGRLTVQGAVEEALALIVRRPVRLTVAGRTDAGVHARGQVTHLDLHEEEWLALSRNSAIEPGHALVRRLRGTLGRILGEAAGAIVVHGVRPAEPGFDARFSALWRRYSYRVADRGANWDPVLRTSTWWYRSELDLELLNQAAAQTLGLNDFLAFCKPREGATTVRELQRFDFRRDGDGVLVATVQADAFCHNMVRALIGSVVQVGSGAQPPDWMGERLAAKARDAQSLLAPPHPLVLEEVAYPDAAELGQRAELTRAVRTADMSVR